MIMAKKTSKKALTKQLTANAVFLSIIFSSQIEFERYTIDDGLSQNTVQKVMQDSRGYIWLGTQGGLDRFNGYEFVHYESESSDSTTIPFGYIWSIEEDKNGIMWLGTQQGNVGWFNPYSEEAGEINIYKNNPNIKKKRIRDILLLGNNIFIATQGSGLCRYNLKNKTAVWYGPDSTFDKKIESWEIISLNQIDEDKIILSTADGLKILNTKTNEISPHLTTIFKDQLDLEVDSLNLAQLTIGPSGLWYLGSWNKDGFFIYNPDTKKIKRYLHDPEEASSIAGNNIENITVAADGKIWLSIWQVGLSIFNPKTEKFLNIYPDLENKNALSDPHINSIIKDKSGAMWLGCGRSLAKYDPEKKKFGLIANSLRADIKTNQNDFWGITIDSQNNLWLGGGIPKDGFDQIDLNTHEITNIVPESSEGKKGLSRWYLQEDGKGRIWGRSSFDLVVSDLKKANFRSAYDFSNISFKDAGFIRDMYLDRDKRFWACSQKKTWWVEFDGDSAIWKDAGEKFKNMKDIANLVGFVESKIHPCYYSLNWRGNKVIKINKADFSVETLYDDETATDKIRGLKAAGFIYEANDGALWIPTYGEGLTRFDPVIREIIHYGIKNGLPNSYLYSVYEDGLGNMWMSSNFGIIKLNPKTGEFRQFGMADGVQNLEFNGGSHGRDKDGVLYFGGISGVNYFHPDSLKDNPNEPTVIIESFSKSDSIFIIHKSDNSEEIYNVYYDEKDLSFNFAAIDYRDPSRNKHAYMMEGYDADWNYSGTRRYASYTNLPHGDYIFRVKGSNNDGMWNDEGASLKIKIFPAPWETTWAYMMYFATTGMGLFGYVKRQRRLQTRAMEEQHREAELEEARQFQLDMLPKEIPDVLDLEIAATIQTASEVGGDYYDFFPQKNGESLYVAVGDATGHGMTAGMMVSITKAGLYGIPSIPPNDIAKRLNRVIKNIDLGWNRMAFNMARFWEGRVEFTSAAMPPAYHYHGETGEVDEILIEGLPLGSFKDETFTLVGFEFKQGDSLVFISDGLPEAANTSEEMLGYEAVQDCVQANGHQNAEEQKQALLDLGTAWLGDLRNQDDITIVVVKKKQV